MKDITVLAARAGVPYLRFEKQTLGGDAAALIGAKSIEQIIAEQVHARLGRPSRIEERRARVEDEKKHWVCAKGCWLCCASHKKISVPPAEARAVWAALAPQAPWTPIHPNACAALGPDGAARFMTTARPSAAVLDRPIRAVARTHSPSRDAWETEISLVRVRWPYDAHEIAEAIGFLNKRSLPRQNLITTLRACERIERPRRPLRWGKKCQATEN